MFFAWYMLSMSLQDDRKIRSDTKEKSGRRFSLDITFERHARMSE